MEVTDKIDEAKLKISRFLNDNEIPYLYVDTEINHRDSKNFYVIAVIEVLHPLSMKKLSEQPELLGIRPYTNKHIVAKFLF